MTSRRGALFTMPLVIASLLLTATSAIAAAHGPNRINLPNGWAPEGIATGRGNTVYVGSLANGAVLQANVRTGVTTVRVPGVAGKVAVGVAYENDANRLWVAGGPSGEVRVYNASTGTILQTYVFAPAGFLNDLVVTRDAVYVTDSFIQQLDVIPIGPANALPAPSAVKTLPLTGGGLAYVPGQFNANGIVAKRGWLIVVQSITGQLWRINPTTGAATKIELGTGVDVSFGDGLEVHGSTLYVVQNQLNRVEVFKLGPGLTTAKLKSTLTTSTLDPLDGLRVPTTAAFVRGSLYAVNARFGTPVTPTTTYWITRLPRR